MPTIYDLMHWAILAQDAGEGGGGGGEGGGEGAKGADPSPFGGNALFMLFGMMIILYIFMVFLPQSRDRKRSKEMLEGLKKNDRVLFAGGIKGTVANIHQDGYVTIRIDDATNAKMKVLRASISRVFTDEDEKDEKGESGKKATKD